MGQAISSAAIACMAAALVLPYSVFADALAGIRGRGTIRWGADQEGGGPYVFPKDADPAQVTGFEVDIADRIGEYLKVRAVFTQGQWDKIPDMLRTGKIDVVLNGYELTPGRTEVMDATIPYYVYLSS
jgi:polar amino acid transport system substrate-binding protein